MNALPTSTENSVDSLLGEILDDFLERQGRGERPDAEEYAQRYPQLAPVLRQMLPALQWLPGPAGVPAASAETAAPPAYAPGYLGDYRIVREVGRGGMGVVYEAEQVSLNRKVALKVLPFAAAMDPKYLQRFKNEAQAAAQLHHQHIVPVYGIGCERGMHYYAMQYIEGPTVATLVHELTQRRQPQPSGSGPASATAAPAESPGRVVLDTGPIAALPTEHSAGSPAFFRTVAQLGVQAAEALEHAHGLGVVHRDIKPANLLVDAHGHLWITDFGLARLQNDMGLTLTGDLLGTLRYMSPEQALAKHGLVDHRTDIYSLGATLYELLTLQPACSGKDRQEVLRQIETEEPPPPRSLHPAVPPDLETIVLKALAKELDSRYATAQELADDLRRFLDDKPIQAKRPTPWQRARKWVRRHQGFVVTSGVAAALILLTVMAALIVGIVRVKAEQQRTEQEHQAALAAQGRAETSYRLAREALEECVRKVIDDPRLNNGELEDLQRVVRQVEVLFLQKFVQLHGEEAPFQVERGKAYLQLGEYTQRFGTREDAIGPYQQALAIFAALARDHPEVAEYRALLARSHLKLGFMDRGTGKRARAEEAYRQALALQKALVAADPLSAEYRYDLAVTYGYLAVLYQETRLSEKATEAEKAYQKAVVLGQSLIHDYPLDPKYQQILASSYTNLGLIYLDTKRLRKAEQVLREALALRRELVKADPQRPDHQRYLAITCQNLAELYQKTGRSREAEQAYQEGLECLEVLVREHPLVLDYATDLGEFQGFLGDIVPNLDKRLEWYGKSVQTLEAVLQREANHARARQFLCHTYGRQVAVLKKLNRQDEALHALNRLLQLFPQNKKRDHWRLERAKTLAKLKRHTDAVAEAQQLLSELPGIDAGGLVGCAGVYALAYAAAGADEPGQAEQYAAQSLEMLRRAGARGFQDTAVLKTDGDFAAMRQRSDFQKLLVEIEHGRESYQP